MQDFEELAHILGVEEETIYREMRSKVMHEIAFRELAITTIMRDLIDIRRRSPQHADIIEYAVASPFCSYEELAAVGKVSKQAIFSQMRSYRPLLCIGSVRNEGKPADGSRKKKG